MTPATPAPPTPAPASRRPRRAGRAPRRRARHRRPRARCRHGHSAARGLHLVGPDGDRDQRRGPLHHRAGRPGRHRLGEGAGLRAQEAHRRRGHRRHDQARAASDPRRVPHLLRRRRPHHPPARAGPRGAHRAQRGRHRHQGRSRADPLSHLGPGRARRGRAGAGHHQGLRRPARGLEGAGHLHHRPDRGLQGQRARHDPARPGHHRHPHRQAVDRPREPGVGGSVPRGELGLHHRGGEGSGAQGLRRDPVRLRALPHRRQARRRALLPAQHAATRLPAIAALPGQGPARAGADRRLPGRRHLRLHRLQRERHRHRAAHRGDLGAASTTSAPWSTRPAITWASPASGTRW